MSETLELFLLLGALYVMECSHWVRRTTVGVLRRGRRGRVLHPPAVLGHEYSGLLVGSVRPPFGVTWLLHGWPGCLGAEGWAVPFPQALDPARGPFPQTHGWPYPSADTPPRLEGAALGLGGGDSILTGSPAVARWWRDRLLDLGALDAGRREACILGLLDHATDPQAVRRSAEDLAREARWLGWAGHGMFLWVFLVSPLWTWWSPLVLSWPWLLGGLVGFWGLAQVLFHGAHRRLLPERSAERWGHLIHATFLPLSAIRHRDRVAQDLLVGRDPLVALAVLLGPSAQETVAAGLRDLAHPLWRPADRDSPAFRTVQWFRQQHASRVRSILAAEGFDVGPVPPAGNEVPRDGAPCPRCREPWPRGARTCGACAFQPT